jgi:hypothetical protein
MCCGASNSEECVKNKCNCGIMIVGCWSKDNILKPIQIFLYTNVSYQFNCPCGHKIDKIINNITSKKSWCDYCSPYTSELCDNDECKQCFEKSFASHEQSKYWSKDNILQPRKVVKSSAEKYKFKCKNDQTYNIGLNHLSRSDMRGCIYCNEAKGELETRQIFERFTCKKFLKCKNIFSNPLYELDGYNDEILIAFEHQGIQHYEYIPFFHRNGISDFHKQQERDLLKRDECLKLGIRLIEVSYTLDNSPDKELFIRKKLEELNIC